VAVGRQRAPHARISLLSGTTCMTGLLATTAGTQSWSELDGTCDDCPTCRVHDSE
jgi:hypothetical protein